MENSNNRYKKAIIHFEETNIPFELELNEENFNSLKYDLESEVGVDEECIEQYRQVINKLTIDDFPDLLKLALLIDCEEALDALSIKYEIKEAIDVDLILSEGIYTLASNWVFIQVEEYLYKHYDTYNTPCWCKDLQFIA